MVTINRWYEEKSSSKWMYSSIRDLWTINRDCNILLKLEKFQIAITLKINNFLSTNEGSLETRNFIL